MPTSPMLPAITFFLLGLSLTFAASCPAGGIYNNNFNKCYFYFKQPTVFLEAESQCRSIGANLAVIRNGFENTLVADLVISQSNGTPPTNFWIGVNLLLASKWTWTTNDAALYTNWAPDEPIDPSNSDCGSVRTDGSNLWKKDLCYSALPFVCTADTIDVPSDSPCDPEYTQYENQCFRLFTGFVNRLHYYAADQFCRDQNATLPKITTAGMQNFVAALVFDVQLATWLGLGCDGTNGINDCVWWDGTHPTYTNYAPGNPIGRYPIAMISPGQWSSQQDFWPWSTAVVCQKPVRA